MRRVLAALDEVARRRKLPHAHVALAWLLHQRGVTAPIVGATKIAHLDDAVAALEVKLDGEELRALEALVRAPSGGRLRLIGSREPIAERP